MKHLKLLCVFSILLFTGCESENLGSENPESKNIPYASIEPTQFTVDLPQEYDGSGGLVAIDITQDSKKDFIITQTNHIAAYRHSGEKLWTKTADIQLSDKSERQGLPGLHAPGVQVADIDGDDKPEVLFITRDNRLHVVQGEDGKSEHTLALPSPAKSNRWEHIVVADFRGKGDRDILLQSTTETEYRLGRHLAAYSIDSLLKDPKTPPLWVQNDFHSAAHNGVRVMDLNGDGKDEVIGANILNGQGKILFQLPLTLQRFPHIDSVFISDVDPNIEGLEVIALEEGGDNRVFLYNTEQLIWQIDYKNQEPQNAVFGDFDLERPGLEIWCRSRYNEDQKPFIFDAQGKFINSYRMSNVAPNDWTIKGVEVIIPIHWTGEPKQLAAAKERHESGDVGIFDPVSGAFLYKFKTTADRLYVADVTGDWREELIVLNQKELKIFQNPAPNANPNQPRLWDQKHYQRSKMTWNYYSP